MSGSRGRVKGTAQGGQGVPRAGCSKHRVTPRLPQKSQAPSFSWQPKPKSYMSSRDISADSLPGPGYAMLLTPIFKTSSFASKQVSSSNKMWNLTL